MCKPETMPDNDFRITPPMRQFLGYFGALGPRWGVRTETSQIQALLFLAHRPLDRDEIAALLEVSKAKTMRALADLDGWDMAHRNDDDCWQTSSEPWDLLFTALESRQRREIAPALEALRHCSADAKADADTPVAVRRRIAGVLKLVENLAAINVQSRRLPKNLLPRLVGATGTASRLAERFLPRPSSHTGKSDHGD